MQCLPAMIPCARAATVDTCPQAVTNHDDSPDEATDVQISDQNLTPLTPANWAFGIWGIIFTGQLVAVIYLLIQSDESTVACTLLWCTACHGSTAIGSSKGPGWS